MNEATILVVDDDEKILFAFREVLKKDGYKCIVAKDGEEAVQKTIALTPHVIFMDITMPKLNGLDALQKIREHSPLLPVIIITGYGTMQTAVKAMQQGAFEYLTKPLNIDIVRGVLQRALSSRCTASEEPERTTISADVVDRYELIGTSQLMQDVYKLIGSISTTPNHTSVLILGESGTGKELVARAIHAHSPNASSPFVGINCTVLPESLLESELFGHEKGAFTGAGERKFGKFENAGTGTIFLDEIGNLSLNLQQKLLRVIQEREFERLGGNELVKVEGRFITATNRDIEHEVQNGNFREDLFYRLNVVTVQLPPLRDRMEDVPLLANYFLAKYNRHMKKSVKGFASESIHLLQTYPYPGNVRELENMIERAVMLSNSDVILPEVLKEKSDSTTQKINTVPIISPIFEDSKNNLLRLFEKQFVIDQLRHHHGSVTAAAKTSHMTRQNFQRLMKKYGIHAEEFRG
ncbi:MAG: sigma-54-dependent Fis family transcriptional regulator [Ignavibacteriae bacterium]|nr:sigma-54-dependent Fis family transcriptional regulator [Ignavibacteriota bacterium]